MELLELQLEFFHSIILCGEKHMTTYVDYHFNSVGFLITIGICVISYNISRHPPPILMLGV